MVENVEELRRQLLELRQRFERVYRPDTAAPGFHGHTASTGQCAATSVILRELLGGDMVSAKVEGLSHWFNRIRIGNASFDADITGDQFGLPSLQIAPAESIYSETQVRNLGQVNDETLHRARRLAERVSELAVAQAIDATLRRRGGQGREG